MFVCCSKIAEAEAGVSFNEKKCMFVCCHTYLTKPALVGPKALQYGGDIGNAARRASGSVGLQVITIIIR
jgi:hypothetical protein